MHYEKNFQPTPISEILARAQGRFTRPAAKKKALWRGLPGEPKPMWAILGDEPPVGWRPPEKPLPTNPVPMIGTDAMSSGTGDISGLAGITLLSASNESDSGSEPENGAASPGILAENPAGQVVYDTAPGPPLPPKTIGQRIGWETDQFATLRPPGTLERVGRLAQSPLQGLSDDVWNEISTDIVAGRPIGTPTTQPPGAFLMGSQSRLYEDAAAVPMVGSIAQEALNNPDGAAAFREQALNMRRQAQALRPGYVDNPQDPVEAVDSLQWKAGYGATGLAEMAAAGGVGKKLGTTILQQLPKRPLSTRSPLFPSRETVANTGAATTAALPGMAHDISENTGNLINQGVPEDQAVQDSFAQVMSSRAVRQLITGRLKGLGYDEQAVGRLLDRLPDNPAYPLFVQKLRDTGYRMTAAEIEEQLRGLVE